MFSKLVRQTHMYLGLFLAPWIMMYALSTIVMNHRPSFSRHFGGALAWGKEAEQTLPVQFSPDATPQFMGEQVLQALHIESDFRASLSKDKETLTIICTRLVPRRVTYSLANGKLLLERQETGPQPWLETLHRRRGFGGRSLVNNSWAVSVDIVVVGIIFWVLSGLWMWWELKITRVVGGLVAAGGLILFGLLLFTI